MSEDQEPLSIRDDIIAVRVTNTGGKIQFTESGVRLYNAMSLEEALRYSEQVIALVRDSSTHVLWLKEGIYNAYLLNGGIEIRKADPERQERRELILQQVTEYIQELEQKFSTYPEVLHKDLQGWIRCRVEGVGIADHDSSDLYPMDLTEKVHRRDLDYLVEVHLRPIKDYVDDECFTTSPTYILIPNEENKGLILEHRRDLGKRQTELERSIHAQRSELKTIRKRLEGIANCLSQYKAAPSHTNDLIDQT